MAYIGATGFSGSTLLAFLLNAQPGVVSIGEMAWSIPKKNPGSFRCSCGATLEACPFWLDVGREMKERGHTFDADHWHTAFDLSAPSLIRKLAVRPLGSNVSERLRDAVVRTIPPWGRHLLEVGKQNAALVDSITTLRRATVFVDASKDPARVRFLRQYSNIEPYVIHLVRDPLGFVNSYIKHVKSPRAFDNAIRWWNWTVGRMERLRKTTPPNRWIRIRYEDLCENPKGEIERLLGFFGIAGAPPILNFRSTPHHIIGNRMRLGDSSNIKLDRSWRDELSSAQQDLIKRKTMQQRLLLDYGGNSDRHLLG